MPVTFSILLSAFAILLSVSATYLIRKIALHYKILNRPNPLIPQHTHATPLLGGVGIFIGTNVTLLLLASLHVDWLPSTAYDSVLPVRIILPSFLVLLFGIADDIWTFSPIKKILLQLAIATCAVSLGLIYTLTKCFFLDAIFSGFLILVLMNAFNLTDVCDGLATGIGIITFTFFHIYYPTHTTLTMALIGATTGFLIFNSPPASIFLGDAGSNFLGFMVAAIMLSGSQGHNAWPYVPIMMLFSAVPIFELLFLIGVRIKKRLTWWKGSSDHFSLRLQASGMSKRKTISVGWLASLIACAIALVLEQTPLLIQILLVALVISLSIRISFLLLRWEVSNSHSR